MEVHLNLMEDPISIMLIVSIFIGLWQSYEYHKE